MVYVLYRCAELAAANGYAYFETRGGIDASPVPAPGSGAAMLASADVWMLTERPADASNVHEAAVVLRTLAPWIERH